MPKRSISLSDIARQAKVSAMTVSRALNAPENVTPETRDRILSIIKKHGYRKDTFASINARKRHNIQHRTIAVNCSIESLTAAHDFPFFSIIYFSFMQAIMNQGYRTVLTDIDRDTAQFVNAGQVDAVLLCGPVSDASRAFIERSRGDAALITVCAGPGANHAIDPDDESGGAMAARIFAENGHTHVAVLSSDAEPNHRDRFTSFKRTFGTMAKRCRVDHIDARLVREQAVSDSNVLGALTKYFSSAQPTGIFVTNSYSAYLAYRFFNERGIRIPNDISFLGYDNTPFYRTAPIGLSRIWFDPALAGTEAAGTVAAIFSGNDPSSRMLLPVTYTDMHSVTRYSAINDHGG
ncbi:MAG: LacI family DNA-binding transcriptional regulator [Spirochaetota bacterium]